MWGGSIRFTTAMLFATAFLIEFVIGGLSGVTFAAAPIDWQVTDTYYVVAHFHYVLFGGTAFAVFGGHLLLVSEDERAAAVGDASGTWHFWLMVVGFNLTFFVQHFLGILGMPRRVFTYPDLPCWGALNMISTVGAFVMGVAVARLRRQHRAVSLRRGKVAGDNPWDAWTLEWATTSPPPHDNFDEVPPVRGRARSGTSRTRPCDASPVRPPKPSAMLDKGVVARLDASSPPRRRSSSSSSSRTSSSTTRRRGRADGGERARRPKTGVFTACLLASSVTLWLSERSLERSRARAATRWLIVDHRPRRGLPRRAGHASTSGSSRRNHRRHEPFRDDILYADRFSWPARYRRSCRARHCARPSARRGFSPSSLDLAPCRGALLALCRCRLARRLLDRLPEGARMTTRELLLSCWTLDPLALFACVIAVVVYAATGRTRAGAGRRGAPFAAGLLVLALAVFSPSNT